MSQEVRIALASQTAAARLYNEGLEQGVVTARLDPPPDQGDEVAVIVEAAFADALFRLKGLVVHADDAKTAIWIAVVPGDLKRLCIGAEETIQPPPDPEDEPDVVESLVGQPSQDVDASQASLEDRPTRPSVTDTPPRTPEPATHRPSPRPETVRSSRLSRDTVEDRPTRDERPAPDRVSRDSLGDTYDSEPSEDALPSLGDLGLPSIGGRVAFDSRDSADLSSDTDRPGRPKDYLSRRLSKEREARPGKSIRRRWAKAGRREQDVDRAMKADPFVDGSGIAVPNQPDRRVPGIIAFETTLGGSASYDVFMRVLAKRITGVAVWDVADGRYWAYVVGGGPVHYVREPSLETEAIETLIGRKNLVSEPVLEQARRLATLTGRPLVSVVMRLRLISETQLFNLRGDQTRMVTEHLLDCTTGTVRLYEVPEIREVFQESGSAVLKMLWRHAAKSHESMDSSAVRSKLEAMKPKFVSLTTEGKAILHKLPLSSVQQTFVNRLLRPSRPVRKLFTRMEMAEVDAARLLLSMQRLGLVLLAARGAENQKDAEIERKLRDRFRRVDRDVFGFLGLHWSALPEELAEAVSSLDAELKKFSTIGDAISNFDAMRSALLDRLEEARGLLSSEKQRQKYRRKVVDANEQFMAAETLLKQGEMALFRRDRKQARECFARMLEIDPGGSGSHDRRERAKTALLQLEDGRASIPGD